MLEDPSDPHSILTVVDFDRTNWLPISFFWWEVIRREYCDGPFSRLVAKAVRELLPEPPYMDNVQAIENMRLKRGQQGF